MSETERHASFLNKFRNGMPQQWLTIVMKAMIIIMAISASVWLAYQFSRLIFLEAPPFSIGGWGGIDLRLRILETKSWIAGESVYGTLKQGLYPPASYIMLVPFTTWASVATIRWLWAIMYVFALTVLIVQIARGTGVRSPMAWIFVALLPLSMYATGATIGNGQFTLFVLPLVIGATLLLYQPNPSWATDVFAAILMAAALVKPTVATPFFWLIIFIPGRLRPALITAAIYVVLTVIAAEFQQEDVISLLLFWIRRANPGRITQGVSLSAHTLHSGVVITATAAASTAATATAAAAATVPAAAALAADLPAAAVSAAATPAAPGSAAAQSSTLTLTSLFAGINKGWALSVLMLALSGVWVYRNRKVDPWILLGVLAIVARLWTYHRWFDDMLLLLPMIALLKIAGSYGLSAREGKTAGILFALLWLVMLAPGLHHLPLPRGVVDLYLAAQLLIWLSCGLFLMIEARKARKVVAEP